MTPIDPKVREAVARARQTILSDIRGRRLLKWLFSESADEDPHAIGYVDGPIDIEIQNECAETWALAAIAAYREAVGDGWQPIATAPKDGTWILGVMAGNHPTLNRPFVPATAHWDNNCWTSKDHASFDDGGWDLTHWRPLPEPPSEAVAPMLVGNGDDGA